MPEQSSVSVKGEGFLLYSFLQHRREWGLKTFCKIWLDRIELLSLDTPSATREGQAAPSEKRGGRSGSPACKAHESSTFRQVVMEILRGEG